MNQQAGRAGSRWQRVRLACLTASRGWCALCGSQTCPTCGQHACGGNPAPGQADHIVPPDVAPHLAEEPANLRPAHGHCNRARNRFGAANPNRLSRQW